MGLTALEAGRELGQEDGGPSPLTPIIDQTIAPVEEPEAGTGEVPST